MRFMIIVKASKESEAGIMPSSELIAAMGKFNEDLIAAGVLLAGEGLQSSAKGKRVKLEGGKFVVKDGPFAETKELVAGFWIIDVKDEAEALEWVKRIPYEEGDEYELRKVFEASDFQVDMLTEDVIARTQAWRDENMKPITKSSPMRFVIFRKADAETEAETGPAGGTDPAHMEALIAQMMAYNEELAKAGVLIGGDGLMPSRRGARVKFSGGKPTVIDGPFAEAKELVAGFTLIQVGSREEAIEWLKKWPPLDGRGNVELELRQIYESDDFGDAFTPELREQNERVRMLEEKNR